MLNTVSAKALGGRASEAELYNPLIGDSMLELGNKKNRDIVYKQVFERLGFRHVSVDTNGQNGALPVDLREPLKLGTFDMVANIGTTEHVAPHDLQGQTAVWRNICEAMHIDSVLVSMTPHHEAVRWKNHGYWRPDLTFFHLLADLNGLVVERGYYDRDTDCVCARLRRLRAAVFIMPGSGLHENT